MKVKAGALVLGLVLVMGTFSSCVTSTRVHFETDVEGATVYVDGESIGVTPTEMKMSNAIWESPDILIKKEGYKDLNTDVKKEVKAVNLVCGLLVWYPSLLWVYGPKKNQTYVLTAK